MSKNKLLIVILMLTTMLTGCFPTGAPKQSSAPETSTASSAGASDSSDSGVVSEPAAFAVPNDLEHVSFDIELPDNYPTELPVIKAKKHIFDEEEKEKIISLFFEGKEVRTGKYNDYYADGGAHMFLRDNRFSYELDHFYDNDEEKQLIYTIQRTASYDAESLYMQYPNINSELEGFPRSEAEKRADGLVKKLGVKYLGEPTVYTFTSEDVNVNVQGQITTGGKEGGDPIDVSLPKEDQFYLIRYIPEYDGIPIPRYISNSIFGDVYHTAPYVDIILTKDELVCFDCFGMFDELEVTDTTSINCGSETALSKMYDYYSLKDKNMEYRLEYYSLDFAYVTYESDYNTREFVYKPLWRATGQYVSLEDPARRRHIDKFIDPATGLVFDTND